MRHTIIDRILYIACAAAAVAAAGGCGHSSDTAAPAVTPQTAQPQVAHVLTQQQMQMQNATEAMDEKAHENMMPAKTQ